MGRLPHLGKTASIDSFSFNTSCHQQSLLLCYFHSVLGQLGAEPARPGHKESAVLGFLNVHGQHSDTVCTLFFFSSAFFFFLWLEGWDTSKERFNKKNKITLQSYLEAMGECLNKDQLIEQSLTILKRVNPGYPTLT